jgi:hypothetical protein
VNELSGSVEGIAVPKALGPLGGGGAVLVMSHGSAPDVLAVLWLVVAVVTLASVVITLGRLLPRPR